MKKYIQATKPKKVFKVVNHSMIATKILFANKGFHKPPDKAEKQEANKSSSQEMKNTNVNKKKDKSNYKEQEKL